MGFEEKKQKIMDTLIEQMDLQSMANVAAEVLGNPLFLADTSLQALVYSQTEHVEDDGWNVVKLSVREEGVGVRDACLQEILGSGALEKTVGSDEPVISSYSFSSFRYIGARICDHSALVGQATVIECFKPFTEEDGLLLRLFCKVVVYALRPLGKPEMRAVQYYGLMTALLGQEPKLSREDVASRAKNIALAFPKKMRVVLVQPQRGETHLQQFYIRTMLLREFPRSIGIVRDSSIVMVVNAEMAVDRIRDVLRTVLRAYQVRAGVSQPFREPDEMRLYYKQAKEAVHISSLQDRADAICFYQDIVTLHLLASACRFQPAEMFYSPLFRILLEYDADNRTTFVEDLRVYLDNGKNIGKAAQQLFIHKNSMYYRIAKIEEIIGASLKDDAICFALQLSLKLYMHREFLESYGRAT